MLPFTQFSFLFILTAELLYLILIKVTSVRNISFVWFIRITLSHSEYGGLKQFYLTLRTPALGVYLKNRIPQSNY